jgi:hypothetical protein
MLIPSEVSGRFICRLVKEDKAKRPDAMQGMLFIPEVAATAGNIERGCV